MQNVVLTGFMGSGKSTVGRLLAERLGYRFVDTDEVIVARDGRAIADIFAEDGEATFRDWEKAAAQELAEEEGMVIATGGRLMLDRENGAALEGNGRVFCLTARPETILARLADDAGRRPLLAGPNPAERIEALLARRALAYGRYTPITTDGKTAAAVAAEIAEKLAGGTAVSRFPVTHPTGEYDVVVGENLLSQIRHRAGIRGLMVVVTDSNVGPLYAAQCEADHVITVPAGEAHKRLETVQTIYDELLAAGADRTATIVALGGGVVGDMAGFAAATYMRGVPVVQCPTSLLAMVDAGVGGKTGVDLPQGKNLVGAFKQPRLVLADAATLTTLPAPEWAAGMAEVVKHGLIAGGAMWEMVQDGRIPREKWQTMITAAIRVKRDVVQSDPFERGRRAILNLGHTFGHAIEQVSGYAIRHGEGVAMGLAAAANLSARLGHCDPALQPQIEGILAAQSLPTRIPAALEPAALYEAMGSDKKKAGSRLRFILLRGVGEVFVTDEVGETAVMETLEELKKGD